MEKKIFYFIAVLFFIACGDRTDKLFSLQLQTIEEKSFDFSGIKNNNASVMIYLSPGCPLCQHYALTINKLVKTFSPEGISFFGVVAGKYYTRDEIREYAKKYEMTIPILLDENYELAHLIEASVTPEVFVLNKKGEVLYKGLIDNYPYAVGKNRTVVTEHHLKKVLESIAASQHPEASETKAIGCYIE